MASDNHLICFDAAAAREFAEVKAKAERRAIYAAVEKLGYIGERLAPPYMKPLRGDGALRELRPRRGDSPWRPLYQRLGAGYVILAIAHKDTFDAAVARARERARDYAGRLDIR